MTGENKKFRVLLILAAIESGIYIVTMEASDIQPQIVRWTFQCLSMTLVILTIIRAFYWKGRADERRNFESK